MVSTTELTVKQSEIISPFEDTRRVNAETDFLSDWLCWNESICEDIEEYLICVKPLTLKEFSDFLKELVILEVNNNRTFSCIHDRLVKIALRRVDWNWLAQNYLTCQN